MPTAVTPLSDTARRVALRDQFIGMAQLAQGRPFGHWPGWSTGETLIVALLLNRGDALQAMGYSMLQAFERNDLFSLAELLHMQREVRE